jgi:hypothetical protein
MAVEHAVSNQVEQRAPVRVVPVMLLLVVFCIENPQ